MAEQTTPITPQTTDIDPISLREIRKRVIKYNLDPKNTAVWEYYDKDNIWKTLKIERNENRHSAFLAWFLGLDYKSANAPIYRLLALLASNDSNSNIDNSLVNAIAYQTLKIKKATPESEKVISTFTKIRYPDRIDIFITCEIEGCGKFNKIEIIVENKVESSEGGAKTKREKTKVSNLSQEEEEYCNLTQTERYFYACHSCRNDDFDSKNTLQIFVFLTPKDEKPTCDKFIKISYQDLVDHIFDPFVISKGVNDYAKNAVAEYMRVLCNPNHKSILATMKEEKELLEDFYDRNIDLFKRAIQIKKIIADENGDVELANTLAEQEKSIQATEKSERSKPSFTITLDNQVTQLHKPYLSQPAAKIVSFLMQNRGFTKDDINSMFGEVRSPLILSEDDWQKETDQRRWKKISDDQDYYITNQYAYYQTKSVQNPNFPKFMEIANKIEGVKIEVIKEQTAETEEN